MDLIKLALIKNHTQDITTQIEQEFCPQVGDNGNWFVRGIDTGISATPQENLKVLYADTDNHNLVINQNGEQIIVGDYGSAISLTDINNLFGN